MTTGRKIWKSILTVVFIISFTFTVTVGIFAISNFSEVSRMLQVGLVVKTQYLHEVTLKQMLRGAIGGMVESLGDPYSVYMEAKEFKDLQDHIQGSLGGIGIYVAQKDKNLVVVAPIEGTPAQKAGILKGDIITKINNVYTNELNIDQAIAMMRGEPGTQVSISILREGAAKLAEYTLTRESINVPTAVSSLVQGHPTIGYLHLAMFASNTDAGVEQELKKLQEQKIKALILDLRDNPGGDLNSTVNIAKHFVPQGPIVYTIDKFGKTEVFAASNGQNLKIPLVVLVNGGSASASEVLAGAIKDTKAGTLIGEKTFGKGIIQIVFPMGGGDGLKLTTAKYLTPNKNDIHAMGIEPDIQVVLTEKDKEDTQMMKAIEVLLQKLQ